MLQSLQSIVDIGKSSTLYRFDYNWYLKNQRGLVGSYKMPSEIVKFKTIISILIQLMNFER